MKTGTKNFNWVFGGMAFLIAAMFIAFGGTRAVGLAHAQEPPAPTTEAATSNEDPSHESNETADQEAAEDSGQGWGRRMHGEGSNEDSAHEASESAEREAAEDAGQTQQTPSDSATPSN